MEASKLPVGLSASATLSTTNDEVVTVLNFKWLIVRTPCTDLNYSNGTFVAPLHQPSISTYHTSRITCSVKICKQSSSLLQQQRAL